MKLTSSYKAKNGNGGNGAKNGNGNGTEKSNGSAAGGAGNGGDGAFKNVIPNVYYVVETIGHLSYIN